MLHLVMIRHTTDGGVSAYSREAFAVGDIVDALTHVVKRSVLPGKLVQVQINDLEYIMVTDPPTSIAVNADAVLATTDEVTS